jgi:hypothetical protein
VWSPMSAVTFDASSVLQGAGRYGTPTREGDKPNGARPSCRLLLPHCLSPCQPASVSSVVGSFDGMPNRDLRVTVLQFFGSMPSLLSRASMAAATCSGATRVCRCWPRKVVTGHPRASASFLSVL